MKFLLTHEMDPSGRDVIKFSGEVTSYDLMRLKLHPIDRSLLDIPSDAPAADSLLALEMLFRRADEQFPTTDSSTATPDDAALEPPAQAPRQS